MFQHALCVSLDFDAIELYIKYVIEPPRYYSLTILVLHQHPVNTQLELEECLVRAKNTLG